jgi:hypothetical protein
MSSSSSSRWLLSVMLMVLALMVLILYTSRSGRRSRCVCVVANVCRAGSVEREVKWEGLIADLQLRSRKISTRDDACHMQRQRVQAQRTYVSVGRPAPSQGLADPAVCGVKLIYILEGDAPEWYNGQTNVTMACLTELHTAHPNPHSAHQSYTPDGLEQLSRPMQHSLFGCTAF